MGATIVQDMLSCERAVVNDESAHKWIWMACGLRRHLSELISCKTSDGAVRCGGADFTRPRSSLSSRVSQLWRVANSQLLSRRVRA